MKLSLPAAALCTLLCSVARGQAPAPDTLLSVRLGEVEVRSSALWKNDTVRYRFNQLKYYVTTILPYLNAATVTFSEVDRKLNDDGLRGSARRQYIALKDRELRTQFEDRVKGLNETQGVLLIKLISRQTGANVYRIIQETKGGVTAVKWQAWARMHGHNLNKRYDPADEPLLERVMESLGYELPAFYAKAE